MVAIIKGGLKVLGRLAWLSPALYQKRRHAVAIFRQGLYSHGLDQEIIEELCVVYKDLGNVRRWFVDTNQRAGSAR